MALLDDLMDYFTQTTILGMSLGLLLLVLGVLLVIVVVYYAMGGESFEDIKPKVYTGPAAESI